MAVEKRIPFDEKEQKKLFKQIYSKEKKAALEQIKEHEKRFKREEKIKKAMKKIEGVLSAKATSKRILKKEPRASIVLGENRQSAFYKKFYDGERRNLLSWK